MKNATPPGDEAWNNLAHAIVIKAVEDYRSALQKLVLKRGDLRNALRVKKECEIFFSSDWCKFLTDVDMVKAAKMIRQEVFEK